MGVALAMESPNRTITAQNYQRQRRRAPGGGEDWNLNGFCALVLQRLFASWSSFRCDTNALFSGKACDNGYVLHCPCTMLEKR